jgi:hypothetical protein
MPEAARARLLDLASNGDIMGLQRELEKCKANAAAPTAWVGRLSELAAGCKIKAIREILEKT